MKRRQRISAIIMVGLMMCTPVLVNAQTVTHTETYKGYKFTLTAEKNTASAYGYLDYETTSSFTPVVALNGTFVESSGLGYSFEVLGSFSAGYRATKEGTISRIDVTGTIDGTVVKKISINDAI